MATGTIPPMTRQGVRDLDHPKGVTYPMTHQGVRDLDRPMPETGPGVNVGPAERDFSKLGGAVLTGFGLAHGGILGLALAAIGGSLIYRGVTGHCSAYSAAGIDTAHRS